MSEQWKTKICTRHPGCTDVVTLDDVFIVCVRGDKPEVAEAIVRDHNSHDALLAACEDLMDDLNGCPENINGDKYDAMEAAIAAATGE